MERKLEVLLPREKELEINLRRYIPQAADEPRTPADLPRPARRMDRKLLKNYLGVQAVPTQVVPSLQNEISPVFEENRKKKPNDFLVSGSPVAQNSAFERCFRKRFHCSDHLQRRVSTVRSERDS